jgi:hypothetical protein
VNHTITAIQFQAASKRVKEITLLSTSGRHIGHYKAAEINEFLSHINASILSLCLKHGITLQRWKKIIDVMLLKKPGDLQLHRLQIIQLIEADFNKFMRITFAHPLTHQGETHNGFTHTSTRDRNGLALLQFSSKLYMRIMKVDGATMEHDATCFSSYRLSDIRSKRDILQGTKRSMVRTSTPCEHCTVG